jgi:outer membrane protein assembly factor BamA
MKSGIIIAAIVFFVIACLPAGAEDEVQVRINNIYIDQYEVFDSTQSDWFFLAGFLNSFHSLTKRYIIEDELLFAEGDYLDIYDLEETERNLRKTELFTKVKIEIDSINEYYYDVYITTQDRWSLSPKLLLGTGGGDYNYGARITEHNLFGTGTSISFEGLYRSENDIGWQAMGKLSQPRLFRSEYGIDFQILSNQFKTEQDLSLFKPFRTIETEFSYGTNLKNYFGSDFFYNRTSDTTILMPFHQRNGQFYFSKAWVRESRVFATAYLELDDVNRGQPEFERAYDNSGKFLLMFSSVTDDYEETTKLNYWQDEDLPVGGYGSATIGKIFPVGHKGEGLYYIGAQGERSYYDGTLYLCGQVSGGSAFERNRGKYTYQEFLGHGFLRLGEDFLLATRVRQQTVWNWDKLRQLVLDTESGLRGYRNNALSGDNRVIANIELRAFPSFDLWVVQAGVTLFYDAGTVWDQELKFNRTQWHHSAGIGFRIQNMKSTGENSLFRIDFAFNFDENKFAGIIFTTDQLFNAFKDHEYRIPEVFGTEFDSE